MSIALFANPPLPEVLFEGPIDVTVPRSVNDVDGLLFASMPLGAAKTGPIDPLPKKKVSV